MKEMAIALVACVALIVTCINPDIWIFSSLATFLTWLAIDDK